MASLSQPVRVAMARYWSEIYGGAAVGLTTADMFSNIRDRALELGLSSPGVPATAVSVLRGYASSMIRAANALNSADSASALTSQHVAEAPWARSVTEQNTSPIWHASFDHTIEADDGSTITTRQTVSIFGAMPPTVGDLRDYVIGEAALLAAEGGAIDSGTPHGTSLDVGNISVLAV